MKLLVLSLLVIFSVGAFAQEKQIEQDPCHETEYIQKRRALDKEIEELAVAEVREELAVSTGEAKNSIMLAQISLKKIQKERERHQMNKDNIQCYWNINGVPPGIWNDVQFIKFWHSDI